MMVKVAENRAAIEGIKMRNEEEIRKELRKRERIFRRMKRESPCISSSCAMMEGYISALRWVLEER